jgi:hypothetical protein
VNGNSSNAFGPDHPMVAFLFGLRNKLVFVASPTSSDSVDFDMTILDVWQCARAASGLNSTLTC